MAYLSFGANRLTFGANPLIFGTGDAPPPALAPRGDDAFRSSGARDRFWASKAEEYLQDRLAAIPQVAHRPKRARRRFAETVTEGVEAFELPRAHQEALSRLLAALTAPAPDYTMLAVAAQKMMVRIARERRVWRDERDMAALKALGEL